MQVFAQTVGFGIIAASIIAIGAMGFTIQFGLTNVLNLNYGSTMTVGAFVAYLAFQAGVNVWEALVLGGLAGAVLTLVLGKTVFKIFAGRGIGLFEMVMVTLALSIVIEYALEALSGDQIYSFSPPQGASMVAGPLVVTGTQVVIVVIGVGILLLVSGMLHFTRMGKALRAMAADPSLARSCGIPTDRIVNITWIVSGFLCGGAGVVYVMSSESVSFATGYEFLPTIIAAAILGGVGSVRGAVIASLVLGIVTALVSAVGGSAYSTVVGFGVLAAVLLVRPSSVLTASASKTELTL